MNEVSMIPAVRVSNRTDPEIRIYSDQSDYIEVLFYKNGDAVKKEGHKIRQNQVETFCCGVNELDGNVDVQFRFYNNGELLETKDWPYQIIPSDKPATGLLDGCWISLYHWSEEEGHWFNKDLKKLKDEDFAQQIREMSQIGIRGVVIQNLFDSNAYIGRHDMTCESYNGRAFYPSELYSGRMPITANDPVEAVLNAADECGMHVLLGIGLFAWFDFSEESLKWHKNVAKEVFEKYGHHKSFYGWYISEEIMGDLYYSYLPQHAERWRELPNFFSQMQELLHQLAPVKPIAFAPNNILFDRHAEEWKEILPYIDILIPFAFARDSEHWNVEEVKEICTSCKTHMWVDMEIFDMPFEDGLVPKSFENLKKEIESYNIVEQCYGYQYTGLLNHPNSAFNLGGERAKELYERYAEYYQNCLSPKNQ